jgi:hypothetical protein
MLILASSQPGLAHAEPPGSDSRPLSQEEMATFLPLVCLKPARMPAANAPFEVTSFGCQDLIGYGNDAMQGSANLALTAIMYGPFTARDAHEAYVSYLSGREPHSHDFGGGILLRSSGQQWRLIRWYPGEAMRSCLALPGNGSRKTLCLEEYTGQSERDTSVWMKYVQPGAVVRKAVLKAQDDRDAIAPEQTNSRSYPCILGGRQHKAMLLSIDSLTRSRVAGGFGVSQITFATAQSVAAACAAGHFESIKTSSGTVYYRVQSGKVVAIAPYQFSKTDY